MALGTVVSGEAIHLAVPFIGTKNLLYIGALLLLANAALAQHILRIGKPVVQRRIPLQLQKLGAVSGLVPKMRWNACPHSNVLWAVMRRIDQLSAIDWSEVWMCQIHERHR